MQVKEKVAERVGLSSFTRLAISLLVFKVVPTILAYWLSSVIAVGIGAVAALGVSCFLAPSSPDGGRKFTVVDWALVLLIPASAMLIEYFRT